MLNPSFLSIYDGSSFFGSVLGRDCEKTTVIFSQRSYIPFSVFNPPAWFHVGHGSLIFSEDTSPQLFTWLIIVSAWCIIGNTLIVQDCAYLLLIDSSWSSILSCLVLNLIDQCWWSIWSCMVWFCNLTFEYWIKGGWLDSYPCVFHHFYRGCLFLSLFLWVY